MRIAVCSALVSDSDLILLDEPTSCLDPLSKIVFWKFLNDNMMKNKAALLLITHDQQEGRYFTDREVRLNYGRIESESITVVRTESPKIIIKIKLYFEAEDCDLSEKEIEEDIEKFTEASGLIIQEKEQSNYRIEANYFDIEGLVWDYIFAKPFVDYGLIEFNN